MGRRGPKPRLGARSRVLALRTDDAMEEALAEDLAAMQAANPDATQSDVVRSWSRNASRERRITYDAEMAGELRAMRDQAKELLQRAERAEKKVVAYEERNARAKSKSVRAAVVTLRKPDNVRVRQELDKLLKLEAAGLESRTENPTLSIARRELGSWKALQDLVDHIEEESA